MATNAFVSGMSQPAQPAQQAVDPNKKAASYTDTPWDKPVLVSAGRNTDSKFIGSQISRGGSVGGNRNYYDPNGPDGPGYYHKQDANDSALAAKQYYSDQFQSGLPGMEANMGNQLSAGITGQMEQGIKQTQQNNSSRGLLYGGINAGQEGAVRAKASSDIAKGRSSINSGLLDAADKMRSGTVDFGLQLQKSKQALYDSIYQQSMAELASDNAQLGQVLGTAGLIVGSVYGGPAGGMAGQKAGQAAGNTITA